MTMHKLENLIFSLVLVFMFFTSCNGQTSKNQTTTNKNSTIKKEQSPKNCSNFGNKVRECSLPAS
jgi:hypothetical protein